jgi:hypothetical protein
MPGKDNAHYCRIVIYTRIEKPDRIIDTQGRSLVELGQQLVWITRLQALVNSVAKISAVTVEGSQ